MLEDVESTTAKLCAFARAYHSNVEKHKIFDDYLAFDIMGRDEYEEIGQLIEHDYKKELFDPSYSFRSSQIKDKLNKYISPIPLFRAAYTETELWRFARERGECQYVICGAGMDTFAFRNNNPKIKIFEIDHPDTQRYKLEKVRKLEWIVPENLKFVPVDFEKDDMGEELLKAGFDADKPSMFVILGVMYYLRFEDFEKNLETIEKLTSYGSKLIFDFPDDTTFSENVAERVKTLSAITDFLGEPMKHAYSPEEVIKSLNDYGFIVDDHGTPELIQRRYFDGRSDNQTAYENIHIIMAKKADEFNESYYLYI